MRTVRTGSYAPDSDLKAESEKRGIRSPIEIKLCKKSPHKGAKLMH